MDYALAPTAEEEITSLVAAEVFSHRQLPVKLYQIGGWNLPILTPTKNTLSETNSNHKKIMIPLGFIQGGSIGMKSAPGLGS